MEIQERRFSQAIHTKPLSLIAHLSQTTRKRLRPSQQASASPLSSYAKQNTRPFHSPRSYVQCRNPQRRQQRTIPKLHPHPKSDLLRTGFRLDRCWVHRHTGRYSASWACHAESWLEGDGCLTVCDSRYGGDGSCRGCDGSWRSGDGWSSD